MPCTNPRGTQPFGPVKDESHVLVESSFAPGGRDQGAYRVYEAKEGEAAVAGRGTRAPEE